MQIISKKISKLIPRTFSKNKKRPPETRISNERLILPIKPLLLKEASLKNYAAAINLAVDFLRILSQTDASNLCTTLDNH